MEMDGENWLSEQEIQQMVIIWPGISYAFILMHFSVLYSVLFSLLEILLSLYWHQFLKIMF